MDRLSEILEQPASLAHLEGVAAAPARFGQVEGLAAIAPAADDALARDMEQWAVRRAQHFDADVEAPGTSGERLALLRAELKRRHLDGFIVPMSDEFFGEYLPRRARRLTWLTGFSGSAGLAVVVEDAARVWSDGRYTLQLRDQVDQSLFTLGHITDDPPQDWLAKTLRKGAKLGYHPELHALEAVAKFKAACQKAGALLVPVSDNPIDAVWRDQPPSPLAPVEPYDVAYAGESAEAKRDKIARQLRDDNVDAAVITLPESVAWLMNIRGSDIPHTPFVLARAILFADGMVDLFVDTRKLTPAARAHLGNKVIARAPDEFGQALTALGKAKKRVRIDPQAASAWMFDLLGDAGASVMRADDPCLLPKACKNPVELQGIRNAHRRDGVAMVRFLRWLSLQPPGTIDELTAQAKLEAFRRENDLIRDLSFSTISGSGPNGAIVHYRSTEKSNRLLQAGELYLLDSGAQYLDGTTDITRTIAIGQPDAEMRERFTRVMKGHIALGSARFPAGTSGSQLDALARLPLWQAGLDYDHGTGHGVGAYLSVHEGPHRISKIPNTVALRPGMVVSNEPGYYKTGAYGIRLENLVAVTAADDMPGAERPMLAFETLTRAPFDATCLELALLTAEEIAWLDRYHQMVFDDLAPLLDAEDRAWLAGATRPLTA
jgi:Xaa-Pro aminopeptidase